LRYLVKFWGQKEAVLLSAQENSNVSNEIPSTVEYEIRCPLYLFAKYLKDMVKFKIDVVDCSIKKAVALIVINWL